MLGVTLVAITPHWLAVDKPAGLLSVPGRGADKHDSVAARVQAQWPEALVVHRLDMATSGLLLMARDAAAQRALGGAFAARTIAKRYLAVVDGLLAEDDGTIELPLAADWPNRPLQRVAPDGGKPSTTHWAVLSRDAVGGTTRLALRPVTGRSHQLRVHLAAIGHPILGDRLYAPPALAERAARLLLHAEGLAFADPVTGEPVTLDAACPF